jgi:hypothetical protein
MHDRGVSRKTSTVRFRVIQPELDRRLDCQPFSALRRRVIALASYFSPLAIQEMNEDRAESMAWIRMAPNTELVVAHRATA